MNCEHLHQHRLKPPKQSAVPQSRRRSNKTPKPSLSSLLGNSPRTVTDHSGDTARLCSKYRPSVPIITVTRNHTTSRYGHLYRGVYPCLYPLPKSTDPAHWQEDVDARLKWGMKQAIDLGLINVGDAVIAVQGWTGGLGHSNTIRV